MGYEKDDDDYYDDEDYDEAPSKGMSPGIIVLLIIGGLFVLIIPIAIIAAIAIPNLVSARVHGNEAAAIGALRTLSTAQAIHRESDKDGNEIFDYGTLSQLGQEDFIDGVLASGSKQGYVFECQPGGDEPEYTWWATARPAVPGRTGKRFFFTNQSGVIYYSLEDFQVNASSCEPDTPLTAIGQ